MKDFRSERMPSADGQGNAKATFEKAKAALSETIDETMWPLVRPIAHTLTFDLFGFWLIWQLQGGFEGLQKPVAGQQFLEGYPCLGGQPESIPMSTKCLD
jgi:hypothetical protein